MKVRFGDILEEGLRLVITDESWFPDKEIERRGPVSATVFLERKREGLVLLEGRIKTSITLNCDRCLEPFGLDLQDTFKVDLEVSRSDVEPYEHACSSTEMDTMVLAQPEIDIFQAQRVKRYGRICCVSKQLISHKDDQGACCLASTVVSLDGGSGTSCRIEKIGPF